MLRVLGFLLVGGLLVCNAWDGAAAPVPGASATGAPAKDSEEVKKLLRERVEALHKAAEGLEREFKAGTTTLESTLAVAQQLLEAELEVATSAAERRAAHLNFFRIAQSTDVLTAARFRAGLATAPDHHLARAERLKAEIGLRRAGGKPPGE